MPTQKVFVSELRAGDPVQSIFLVAAVWRGEGGTNLSLRDRTGKVRATLQDESDVATDDFVRVRGTVTQADTELLIVLEGAEVVPDSATRAEDFFRTSRWAPAELFKQLQDLIDAEVRSEPLRSFLETLLADQEVAARLVAAPAAMSNHHAYRGGLLEHTLSMARMASQAAAHYGLYYPGLLNPELLLAGVVLHDLAKVWELSYRRELDYTSRGRLNGHIPMGVELVTRIAQRCPRPVSEDLQMHLKHLILAHHGRREYGSPVEPQTAEAVLLHQIDLIDSRMNMWWNERSVVWSEDAEESWSDYRRNLGVRLHFRGRNSADWEPRTEGPPLAGPGVARRSNRGDADDSATNLNLFEDED